MQAILRENRELGWVELPSSCPAHIATRIAEKRSVMLNRRQSATSSAPAAPAVAPKRVSDAERNALASRLSNAIKLF